MRLTLTIIVLGITVLCFFSCKRYPEGGFVKQSKQNILATWKLALYEVNGIDSTDLINYNNSEAYKHVSFFKNVSTISLAVYSSPTEAASFQDENSKLKFSNGEITGIKCDVKNNCYRSFLVPEVTTENPSAIWTIQKLSSKEMRLSMAQKNNYRIILHFYKYTN